MNHTVNTAKVNKSTVSGHGFNLALVDLTNHCLCPESIRRFGEPVFENGADRADSALAFFVHFDNAEFNHFMQQILDRVVAGSGGKGRGYKYPDAAGGNQYAAFNNIRDDPFKNSIGILRVDNIKP